MNAPDPDMPMDTNAADYRIEIAKLKRLLNYVFYARLPMGDKVCDHIPDEYTRQVHQVLHPEEQLPPFRPTESDIAAAREIIEKGSL